MSQTPIHGYNGMLINPGESSEDSQRTALFALVKEERLDEAMAYINRHPDPIKLINIPNPEDKRNLIFIAAMLKYSQKSLEFSKFLIEKGANVLQVDSYGQTPVFFAAAEGNVELLRLLLEKGVKAEEEDGFKQTALFYAAREGHLEVVKCLVEFGANYDHLDQIKETPLFYAASQGKKDMCELLVSYGANVNAVDDKKQTALFFALKSNHIGVVEYLQSVGAIKTKDGRILKAEILKSKKDTDKAESIGAPQTTNSAQNKKKREKLVADEAKLTYRLIYTDQNLTQHELKEEDFAKLQTICPELTKVLLNPELLQEPHIKDILVQEKWQTSAGIIVETLKKNKSSKVFHEPVNWQKLNIPDYPQIVKEPMDFGTIKKKLSLNVYKHVDEFVKDINLIFLNCKLYNGVDSVVGRMGVEVGKEWESLQKTYNLLGRFGEDQARFSLDKGVDLTQVFESEVKEVQNNILPEVLPAQDE